jgi:rfaE bifunctional protein kinase chain/domain|tara:strand:- start:323 stop:1303 length:981 start_codon:yes stop_codon:yes gene_type:complete
MQIDINSISKEYKKKNLLVIGDIILDAYIYGKVDRISQEAPVPILSIDKQEFKPGGAANVALNLCGLGATVTLIGIAGNDRNNTELKKCLTGQEKIKNEIIDLGPRPTTVKTRVIADGRQIVRLDNEVTEEISDEQVSLLVDRFDNNCNDVDGIIIQDYNKGLFTKRLITHVIDHARDREIPVYVDPKYCNYESFKGVRLFKPNQKEYLSIVKDKNFGSLPGSGFDFKKYMKAEILLLTLGSDGMSLYHDSDHESIPTKARQVYDVSGAGDTVIATFAINDVCGLSPLESSVISNLAAGRVCEEVGVCPITIESLKDIFFHHYNKE